jgi:bacterial/archaeal transporter family-2 protein
VTDGRRVLGIGLALVGGALLAVQARINGELGERIGDGVFAALVSFGSGLVILVVATALAPGMRRGVTNIVAAVRVGDLRWWQLAGGTCGAYLVTCQGLTVGTIGVAVFTVAVVGGQSASGLLVDRQGIGPAGPQPVTTARVMAAVGAVVAVAISVSDRPAAPGEAHLVALAALPLVAGLALSWQQAVNGRVGVAAGGPLPATLVNFVVGTAVLVVVTAVSAAVRGLPGDFPAQPWLYVGGGLGIPVVALGVIAVRWIGVLLVGMATVAGQIMAALALDVVAPAAGRGPSVAAVVGCLLALAVVAAAGATGRGRGARMAA